MEQYRVSRRFGVWVICLTLLFRVLEVGLPQKLVGHLRFASPNIQTDAGREARHFSFSFPIESAPPAGTEPEPMAFTPEQAADIPLTNTSAMQPDYGALLAQPLDWNLTGEQPTVLIVHTHTSESYDPSGGAYVQTGAYRTLDKECNMLSIGDRLARRLEAEGIGVIHDREFHDYPSYNSAYASARKSVAAILKEHPTVRLVLDLHRDAVEDGGRQLATQTAIGGAESARLMTVLGVGRSGLDNPRWQENLSLALKLQLTLEAQAPGITRPLSLRPQRFNQDLASYSLLIEVGAAGDTHAAALTAADHLADALIALAAGNP